MEIRYTQFQDSKANKYYFETSADMVVETEKRKFLSPEMIKNLNEHIHDERYYTEEEIDNKIEDLKERVVNGKDKIANAINDKSNNSQMNKDNTFDELANGIRNIPVGESGYNARIFGDYCIIRYLLHSTKEAIKNLYIFVNDKIGYDGKCGLFTTWGGTSVIPGSPIYDKTKTVMPLGKIKRNQHIIGLKWNTIDKFGDDAGFRVEGSYTNFCGIAPIYDEKKYLDFIPYDNRDSSLWSREMFNPSMNESQIFNVNVSQKNQSPKLVTASLFYQQNYTNAENLSFSGQCEGFFYFLVPTKL